MRLALSLAILVAGASVAAAKTPLPERADRSVYDTAGVIDDARKQAIEAIDRQLFERARVAVVVVTVQRLVDETIEELAVRVQHDWGVGERGKDESVVIALSVDDRKIFLATGYGSEGYLPDGKVGAIRDLATPALRSNDYSAGLFTADLAVAQTAAAAHNIAIDGVPAAPQRLRSTGDDDSGVLVVVLVLGAILVFGLLGRRGRGGPGGGGGRGLLAGAAYGSLLGRGQGSWGIGSGGGGDSGGGGFGGFGGGSGGGGGAGGSF
jgi:uncharacterized protein